MSSISGYTTLRCAKEMNYPFLESISSLLLFCDEVCVLDSSDRDDGTLVDLERWSAKEPRLKVKHVDVDWTAPNHGIWDGKTKQMAREMCSGQFLFQSDCDEIVHEDHAPLIKPLITSTDWNKAPLLALPVVEFWGSSGKVRVDVNAWKWRVSVNSPVIVHGIPKELRTSDPVTGLEYAKHGTDGCDYIHRATGDRIPCNISFMDGNHERLRQAAVADPRAAVVYERWFNQMLQTTPAVFHYSWWSIERKIRQYRMFWTGFWKAMYNESRDERENPWFPGLLWSEVSDQMIKDKAQELETGTCGHVFHRPWDGVETLGIKIGMSHPSFIAGWLPSA